MDRFSELGNKHGQRIAAKGPRLAGVYLMGMGGLIVGLNALVLFALQRFFPVTLLLAGLFVGGGVWLLITGRAAVNADGMRQPTWWIVGAVLFAVVGGGAGIWVSELLKP